MRTLRSWLAAGRSRRPRHALAWDCALTLAVLVADVLVALLGPEELTGHPAVVVLLTLWFAVPIVLRRVLLWPALLMLLPAVATPLLDTPQPLTLPIAFAILTYTAGSRLSLRAAIIAVVLIWLPVVVSPLILPDRLGQHGVPLVYLAVNNALLGLVVFLVGRAVHGRRVTARALEERALAAESNQRALAEQAVADERRRIARELHDVVAHNVSVMGVLATGARRVLRTDADAADEALTTIEETSRTAMRELRRMLGVLRTEAEPAAELAPQPGIAGLEALAVQVRDAGLPVTLKIDGTPTELEPGVALTVYRIVQEALTNALKHAGRATAQVRLSFGVYWLIVEVFDTGRGPVPGSEHGAGHGLVGMRERVALYGGTLRVGPRPGGGFRVYAKIPMD
ncbi:sensor histidine kinase [Catenuloplanes atrovinosus]|uniref:histidine kinase n=1 Tax=Catenuloplanes atrovinosus TaxID=137266 RepID=A0AAE4C986_9ACTN|nr:sensor histidine kinase [Catenuloplanes atrovinosus]MDR7274559.1 signal transduction histidine kinase [Catenuloplanes atrovinosus]